jgi:hypothetical protein
MTRKGSRVAGDKKELSAQLGGAAIVGELTDAECAELVSMIAAVRRSRMKAMFSAIDQALNHLPRLLRGPAKKILLGQAPR